MGKYYKTYTRNKKESNISQPLRYSFLKSIFVEGLSVKNVKISLSRPPSNGKCTTLQPKSSLAWPKGLTFFNSSPTTLQIKSPQSHAAGGNCAPALTPPPPPSPRKTPTAAR